MRHSTLAISALFITASCFSTDSLADPTKHMLQVGITKAKGSAEVDLLFLDNVTSDVDSSGFSLSYGMYRPVQNLQLQFGVSRRNLDFDDVQSDGYFWGADADLKFYLTRTQVKPYISLGLGYQNFTGSNDQGFSDDDLSGFNVNLGAGVAADISDNWRLELGYQRKKIAVEDDVLFGLFGSTDTHLNEMSFTIGRFF